MREILFRGKRIDDGEWVEGFLSKSRQNWKRADDTDKMIPDGERYKTNELKYCIDYEDRGVMCSTVIDPSTVGQYTGLTDKNDKKIFEGDIVLVSIKGNKTVCKVAWAECVSQYQLWQENTILHTPTVLNLGNYECEVIGNIHDNSELY